MAQQVRMYPSATGRLNQRSPPSAPTRSRYAALNARNRLLMQQNSAQDASAIVRDYHSEMWSDFT